MRAFSLHRRTSRAIFAFQVGMCCDDQPPNPKPARGRIEPSEPPGMGLTLRHRKVSTTRTGERACERLLGSGPVSDALPSFKELEPRSQSPKLVPRSPQDSPDIAPRWPQDCPKVAPRLPRGGCKMAPRWHQDGHTMAPGLPQDGPNWKMREAKPQTFNQTQQRCRETAPRLPQGGPNTAPRWLQDGPKIAPR